MGKPFKAALAANDLDENIELLATLPYPVIVSPKLDGIRSIRRVGSAHPEVRQYSRSTDDKLTPNLYVQEVLASLPAGWDGEFIVGDRTSPDAYRTTMSGIQSHSGEPDFILYLFDTAHPDLVDAPYEERLGFLEKEYAEKLAENPEAPWTKHVEILEYEYVDSMEELLEAEERYLAEGQGGVEGLMVRGRRGNYRQGRPSLKAAIRDHGLIKLKRFTDSEAVILDFQELVHNDNPVRKDVTGRTRRAGLKEFKRPGGTLGSFLVQDPIFQETFSLRGNITAAEAALYWERREQLRGQYIKYEYQKCGSWIRPRIPRMKGFRDKMDFT